MRNPFRRSLAAKLISLLSFLLLGSIVAVAALSSHLFVSDSTDLIRQMNLETAASLAHKAQESFSSTIEKVRSVGVILLKMPAAGDVRESLLRETIHEDGDVLAVFLRASSADGTGRVIGQALSPALGGLGDAKGSNLIGEWSKVRTRTSLKSEDVDVTVVSTADGRAALALEIPFVRADGRFTHSLLAFVKTQKFESMLAENSIVDSFLVDRTGRLLVSSNGRVHARGLQYLPIVQSFLEGKARNSQKEYEDPDSREVKFGAFHVIDTASMGVIAEVPKRVAMGASKRVVYQSVLFALITLSFAFFIGYLFSRQLTSPLHFLMRASQKIAEGEFKTRFHTTSTDEIGQLAGAFNDMAEGLEERERVKAVFSKFHTKEIAEKILSGEVRLGGEKKKAVVFFSDIRGFTSLSESMTPEEVLEMLNEYMTRMVSIIRAHGGVVDKYIGDAIMALWGVPLENENAPRNAIRACLAMRTELAKLNEARLARGKKPLKIGMGLNYGEVVAGNFGSEEKMEYTVLGDPVNVASRIESSTKTYGTDLLISKSVLDAAGPGFLTEACRAVKVKGKSSSLEIFKVRGWIENGREVLIETPYSSYPAETDSKVESSEEAA